MILNALVEYYHTLHERGQVCDYGFEMAPVSYILDIDTDGKLLNIISAKVEKAYGKKVIWRPQEMETPALPGRSSDIISGFLCDNERYMLGFDAKNNSGRTRKYFEEAKRLHMELLADCQDPVAKAVYHFFETWDPADIQQYYTDDLSKFESGRCVFRCDSVYAHDVPELKAVWTAYSKSWMDNAPVMTDLVTGDAVPICNKHLRIKGVAGTQASGAALVTFNHEAFESYGLDKAYNAQVGFETVAAYASALEYLLQDRDHTFSMGDITVVCWAKSAEPKYQDFMTSLVTGMTFGQSSELTESDVLSISKSMFSGNMIEVGEFTLDPNMKFYLLGLSPNGGRIAVRFFLENQFGMFLQNVVNHYERMKLAKSSKDNAEYVTWKAVISEMLPEVKKSSGASEKKPAAGMSNELLRAILNDTPYPYAILQQIMLRIRADLKVNRNRMAFVKAYYLKNRNVDVPEEVLTVALNEMTHNVPYNLGRLFAVFEFVQRKALFGIKKTIRDSYFNSASMMPAHVFPILTNLCQKHLGKLDDGLQIYYVRMIGEIMDNLGTAYPNHMNVAEQGVFHLGYYHQNQRLYMKKEDKKNG